MTLQIKIIGLMIAFIILAALTLYISAAWVKADRVDNYQIHIHRANGLEMGR